MKEENLADKAAKSAEGPPKRRGAGRPFEVGKSGNPAGCRTGSRHRVSRLLDQMADGEAEAILRKLIEAAKGGDARAAETILRRIWPEPKGRLVSVSLDAVTTAGELSAALAKVLAHVAEGRLTPPEGQQIAVLIETQHKIIETAELAARIEAVEKTLAEQCSAEDGRR
jgi:hypothetical protein